MASVGACRPPRSVHAVVALVLLALSAFPPPCAAAAESAPAPAEIEVTADGIVADVNAAIQWFGQVRVILRAARGTAGMPVSGDEELIARQTVDRAFAAARARSALVAPEPTAEPSDQRGTETIERLTQTIHEGEANVAALQARVRKAPAAQRAALERELIGARNQLELARMRLAFVAQLHAFDAGSPGAPLDLAHQLQTLQASVPDLKAGSAAADTTVVAATTSGTGTWALLHRLVALRQTWSSLADLSEATTARKRALDADLRTTGGALRAQTRRLHDLADVSDAPADMSAEQLEFQARLARARALSEVMVPLQQESALLRRFLDDLQAWRRAIDGETRQALKGVGLDLLRLAAALGAVFVAAALWRAATLRYVADPFRRRLILGIRKVVLVVAVTLVAVVHFASELTTLVTALGFAAAGVAFALQNVILAVAGYFSMMAPNGIRVGDRVSLQGPFGYVHGEVLEIGFVRVRLRELAGEPLAPTGRIVVFPNSVVFTGSFFKHPDGAAAPPGPPAHKAA
jgi:hypothetical protein